MSDVSFDNQFVFLFFLGSDITNTEDCFLSLISLLCAAAAATVYSLQCGVVWSLQTACAL